MGTANVKLLFTCPHGGKEPLDILRKENPFCEDEFIVKREFNTLELTESICQNIEPMIGQIPHIVMASHHRKYVDFNREEPCAFEQSSILAKEKYRAYHDDISLKINEMFSQNEKSLAFLFDIHGFDDAAGEGEPFDVIIGNDHGNSIQALTNVDPDAFWGDNGLIPLLKKKYSVLPRNHAERIAGHILDGGYTIKKYSSHEPERGLVAIQIEVIRSIREDDNRREQFAVEIAECIYTFVRPFI